MLVLQEPPFRFLQFSCVCLIAVKHFVKTNCKKLGFSSFSGSVTPATLPLSNTWRSRWPGSFLSLHCRQSLFLPGYMTQTLREVPTLAPDGYFQQQRQFPLKTTLQGFQVKAVLRLNSLREIRAYLRFPRTAPPTFWEFEEPTMFLSSSSELV